MASNKAARAEEREIELCGRRVPYRIVRSQTARSLRLRVGPGGVEILRPFDRTEEDVASFMGQNTAWILAELRRVEQLQHLRRPVPLKAGEILLRGKPTGVRVETSGRAARNVVVHVGDEIVVRRAMSSRTSPVKSLENWLRRQARADILTSLSGVLGRIGQTSGRLYVMDQRTKWGSCSSRRNLSFNWRLVLAPEYVLRYVVTHEAVHLAVPDHSARFWLTVQSLCPETERARQWLAANGDRLLEPLSTALVASDN